MLSSNDFLIVVYNDLEMESKYRSDLVDLFGSPDGFRRGYLDSITRPLSWDWGISGFRKIIHIMYSLSGQSPEGFNSFYKQEIMHRDNIVETLVKKEIIDSLPEMLYVFKQGARKIPAFTAKIHDVSWKDRIWITFEPTRYMLLDPATWRGFWGRLFTGGREDPQKWFDVWNSSWNITRPPMQQLQTMLHSGSSQDQYHIIPRQLLVDHLQKNLRDEQGTCFTKEVGKIAKRLKLQVPTDNQVFWGLLSEFTGRTQVRGDVKLSHNRRSYSITDIPANTISEESLVFKQEIGAARAICQAMLDAFNEEYLNVEFASGNTKKILDSKFLRRAVQVSMAAEQYDRKYAETDFDYQLDLRPLSKKFPSLRGRKILLDLTAGLWNKSLAKTKEEFIQQWEHNLVKLPEKNDDLIILWHYGLLSEIKDGTYRGQELGDYMRSKANIEATKYRTGAIRGSRTVPRLVLMPFFRDTETRLERELGYMASDNAIERRKSKLYSALEELLTRLRK